MGRTPDGQTREKIFRFVCDHLLNNVPPTTREVQEAFGFRSVQTAREHLEGLVEQGLLTKVKGKARGYRLPTVHKGTTRTVLVPLLGRVQAGPLNIAIEDLEGFIPIQSKRSSSQLFGLRVQGESMIGAGILPGDIVIVLRQPIANSGDIVVGLVGDEATVKRLKICKDHVELHPENPKYQPIIPDSVEITIIGKIIEVHRYLE